MNWKHLLTICMLATSSSTLQAQSFEPAREAVKNMGVGWNLGNTLEAHNQNTDQLDPTKNSYWGQQNLESETCWGQVYATPELMKMMKEAGFSAIRVPVTWYNHMNSDGTVNAGWMARVKEVVGYVLSQGMYCIINVHHDTGADNNGSSYHWIKAQYSNYTSNKTRYENLWKQIATEFKDYDQKLLFESYNEMIDKYNSWSFASFNTTGRYKATDAADAYKAINAYAQSFVDVVRVSGGNNGQRNLIVNTYAACCGSGSWNTHLKEPLTQLVLPEDKATGHLMVQVHDYPNIENGINNVQKDIDDMVAAWNTNFISKGIPMILGEWGTANVDKGDGKTDYDVRRDVVFQFVDYMIKKCKEYNVATFYWMGLTDGVFRISPVFNQPDLAQRIISAYYGSTSGFKFPTIASLGNTLNCLQKEKTISWGDGINISNAAFASFDKTVELELTYRVTSNSGQNIQFNDGSWTTFSSVMINGTAKGGTYNPNGTTGTTYTIKVSFNLTTYNTLCSKGLIIQGSNVTITKAVLKGKIIAGINPIKVERTVNDGAIYNLKGQRVTNPQRGIFIKNGKKFVVK